MTTLVTVERRPLTYPIDNLIAPQVLTPNHFLVGHANLRIPLDVFYLRPSVGNRLIRCLAALLKIISEWHVIGEHLFLNNLFQSAMK